MALAASDTPLYLLEEGDVAEITRRDVKIFDKDGNAVEREVIESNIEHDAGDKAGYRHYMLRKFTSSQPLCVMRLKIVLTKTDLPLTYLVKVLTRYSKVQHVQIMPVVPATMRV